MVVWTITCWVYVISTVFHCKGKCVWERVFRVFPCHLMHAGIACSPWTVLNGYRNEQMGIAANFSKIQPSLYFAPRIKFKVNVYCITTLCGFVWQFLRQSSTSSSPSSPTCIITIMMDFNSTESWLFINTSFPVLPVIASSSNRSGMEGYLQRLAHLDDGLYNDFYGLWIALLVINSLIFLVGTL